MTSPTTLLSGAPGWDSTEETKAIRLSVNSPSSATVVVAHPGSRRGGPHAGRRAASRLVSRAGVAAGDHGGDSVAANLLQLTEVMLHHGLGLRGSGLQDSIVAPVGVAAVKC